MADIINYTNLFNLLRPLTEHFYALENQQTLTAQARWPLQYARDDILDPFETQSRTGLVSDLSEAFDTLSSEISTLKGELIEAFESVLADYADDFYIASSAAADVLVALADAMDTDSESIQKRHLEIDSDDVNSTTLQHSSNTTDVVAHTDNIGSGKLIYTFAQAADLTPNEISLVGNMTCECTTGSASGAETFQIAGEASQDPEADEPGGVGSGESLTVGFEDILTDGNFETWSDTPLELDEWTLDTGTWGTDIIQENSTVYRDSYAAKLPNGVTDLKLQQTIALSPNTAYVCGVWIKKDTGATGDVFLEIVDGDGDQVGTSGIGGGTSTELQIDLANDTSDSSWTLVWFTFQTAGVVESDWQLQIRTSSIATAAAYIDAIQLTAMTQVNGINFAALAGDTDFAEGDKFGYGGDYRGFKVQVAAVGSSARTANSTYSDQSNLIFLDVDYASEFPAGSKVEHPTDGTWHRVTSVSANIDGGDGDGNDDTQVVLSPKALTSWAGESATAYYEGTLQKFIGRVFGVQLPSGDSPTEDDPE